MGAVDEAVKRKQGLNYRRKAHRNAPDGESSDGPALNARRTLLS